ncbi:MAG: CapA family protein [Clostridia bacterium]|nr:CapA family protein [Clostridia bacterium]
MTKKILLLAAAMTLLFTAGCKNSDTDKPPETTVTDSVDETLTDITLTTDAAVIPEEPINEPAETVRISFLAAGDNVIHPCIYMDAERRATAETRAYDFKPMYADVIDYIASFDLAFINQETLMCGEGFELSGYPHFNSPQDLGRDLLDIGFDIVSIANNHMCDKGAKGLSATIDFWESEEMSDILMIGGYRDREDYDNIRMIERDGVKIAFLAYTYDTNGLRLPVSSELVVPYINDNDIIRQCELAKNAADLVFVSIHWGEENISTPTAEQKRVAKLLADNGADVIIGHHPHVLQPIEWIETDHGETLCIYSLGNLLSAMQYWQNMVGGFLTFDIVAMSDGELTIESPEFIPTAFFYGPSYFNSHLYFLRDYPADVAKNHGTGRLYGSYASPDDMIAYAENIMGDYLVLDPTAN